MKYGSVCAGIEAATVAWHPLGWEPVFFSEIEPFPCAVLTHHYPDVPNFGDMTQYQEWPDAGIDVLVGGTPCQSFSVAGLRKGLDDPRGNLMLVFGAIAHRYSPPWLVWENVPGVLSSNGGRDFGTFLGMLAELGYGFAYRVFDAQYFGLAQRRKRVFVVGHLGDWRRAASVLFERESLSGYPPPGRKEGDGASRGVEIGPSGGSFTNINPTLDARCKDGPVRNQLAGAVMCLEPHGKSLIRYSEDIAASLRSGGNGGVPSSRGEHLVCFEPCVSMCLNAGGMGRIDSESETLISLGGMVRKLTPRECERLQGFGDDYTLVEYRGKPATDGPRYKALGNSMAVPVMRWIGQRIDIVDKMAKGEI